MSVVITALHCPTGKRYEFRVSGDNPEWVARQIYGLLKQDVYDGYYDDMPSDWVDVKLITHEEIRQPCDDAEFGMRP